MSVSTAKPENPGTDQLPTPGDTVGRVRVNPVTGFRGVNPSARPPGHFQAAIAFAGRYLSLGTYPTSEEAATAVNIAFDLLGCRHVPRNTIPAAGRPTPERASVIGAIVEDHLRGRRVILGVGLRPPGVNRHTGYRGVKAHRSSGTWSARVVSHRGVIYLGNYPTPHAAAVAHDTAAELLGLPAEFQNRIAAEDLPDESVRAGARAKVEAALARVRLSSKVIRSGAGPATKPSCQARVGAGGRPLTAGHPKPMPIDAAELQPHEAGPGRPAVSGLRPGRPPTSRTPVRLLPMPR